jgi:hypothetical protein
MTNIASDLLEIITFHDAYLAEGSAKTFEGFEPKYEIDLFCLDIQTRAYVKKSEVSELVDDADGDFGLFKVIVGFGARWIRDSSVPEPDMEICAMIESEFIAEYIMKRSVEQNLLDDFALSQVMPDVWPYWREYLNSQCGRMHLAGVKTPTTLKL